MSSLKKTQSEGLSDRHKNFRDNGNSLNDDSKGSENTLKEAMKYIIQYVKDLFEPMGYKVQHVPSLSLYECQKYFHNVGGPEPTKSNENVSMKPDGGIIIINKNNKNIPILIIEDKVQGTNDKLHEEKKPRQATGNAIERGGKNIRGAEMIFSGLPIFPYLLFASGCDFHSSETIAKRIEMMNYGILNHYIDVEPEKDISDDLDKVVSNININKRYGDKSIVSVFVKAHKYDKMKHGSSLWKKDEIIKVCKKVIDDIKFVIEKLDT